MLLRAGMLLCALLAVSAAASAQETLVPTERAPFRQKFDLQVPDAQYLFVPSAPVTVSGPLGFRFVHPALDSLLAWPSTVHYVSQDEGGFRVQVLNLAPADLPGDALGPQPFEIVDSAGIAVGRGTLLVVGVPPEPLSLTDSAGARVFEVGQPTPVEIRVRDHRNYRGAPRVVNRGEFELSEVREDAASTDGEVLLRAVLTPLRTDATELRLAVGTADGRSVELSFPGLSVRPAPPQRVRVSGGPIFLDAAGRGSASLRIEGFSTPPGPSAELTVEGGDVAVLLQHFDPAARVLEAEVEVTSRGSRPPGTRELREVQVRGAARSYRGFVEIVGAPTVTGVRVEPGGRPVLTIGARPAVVRIIGQNLEGLRLDCEPLGSGASCRNLASSSTELVEEVSLGSEAREGEASLPLASLGSRPVGERLYPGGGVRLMVERPAVPLGLLSTPVLEIACGAEGSCRGGGEQATYVVRPADLQRLKLRLREDRIPAEHGWQRLLISVTRVRGDQRQLVRSIGTPGAPRSYRGGPGAVEIGLLDPSVEPRHGDQFIVRVEHAAEQYPPEFRNAPALNDPYVARVYVDAGPLKRLSADVAVQPVLLSFGADGSVQPLYPNAGIGATWQPLDRTLEPRPFSVRLHLLATDLRNVSSSENPARPALALSGNLRIPGTDPSKPLVLSTGLARMFGGEGEWRLFLGAGMDLGVARMIFGG